ncbi:MAG: hypothetical protein H6741_25335 [Alphaproteobacteria bacterium]|nr:hypothetical protein [Alphaproteobacteria bacterium]
MRAFAPLALLTGLALTACIKGSSSVDSSSSSTNCTSYHECVNDVCECEDGTPCDSATCEDDCEICE